LIPAVEVEDLFSDMLNANQLYGKFVGPIFCSILKLLEALVEILRVPHRLKLFDD
jgi:hypothetical protein